MNTIHLTPVQSVTIHGWSNPKRTLTWNDVCTCAWIDVKLLAGAGLTQEDLQTVQPDIHEWISVKGVSFGDVPLMTRFPLHPVVHLGGDLSCLVEHGYSCRTLMEIGLTFVSLRADLGLQPSWMKMMSFTAPEWRSLGMTRQDMECMSQQDVRLVFGVCKDDLALAFLLDSTQARGRVL